MKMRLLCSASRICLRIVAAKTSQAERERSKPLRGEGGEAGWEEGESGGFCICRGDYMRNGNGKMVRAEVRLALR